MIPLFDNDTVSIETECKEFWTFSYKRVCKRYPKIFTHLHHEEESYLTVAILFTVILSLKNQLKGVGVFDYLWVYFWYGICKFPYRQECENFHIPANEGSSYLPPPILNLGTLAQIRGIANLQIPFHFGNPFIDVPNFRP